MNNEEVIKYIGENSKHKHAKLIAEWLLRFPNCEVEKYYVDEKYNHIPELLTWRQNEQYRLLPKIKEESWPSELVERISKIDLDAAHWLKDHWDELDTQKYIGHVVYKRSTKNTSRLDALFNWSLDTEHNFLYWHNLNEQLCNDNGN